MISGSLSPKTPISQKLYTDFADAPIYILIGHGSDMCDKNGKLIESIIPPNSMYITLQQCGLPTWGSPSRESSFWKKNLSKKFKSPFLYTTNTLTSFLDAAKDQGFAHLKTPGMTYVVGSFMPIAWWGDDTLYRLSASGLCLKSKMEEIGEEPKVRAISMTYETLHDEKNYTEEELKNIISKLPYPPGKKAFLESFVLERTTKNSNETYTKNALNLNFNKANFLYELSVDEVVKYFAASVYPTPEQVKKKLLEKIKDPNQLTLEEYLELSSYIFEIFGLNQRNEFRFTDENSPLSTKTIMEKFPGIHYSEICRSSGPTCKLEPVLMRREVSLLEQNELKQSRASILQNLVQQQELLNSDRQYLKDLIEFNYDTLNKFSMDEKKALLQVVSKHKDVLRELFTEEQTKWMKPFDLLYYNLFPRDYLNLDELIDLVEIDISFFEKGIITPEFLMERFIGIGFEAGRNDAINFSLNKKKNIGRGIDLLKKLDTILTEEFKGNLPFSIKKYKTAKEKFLSAIQGKKEFNAQKEKNIEEMKSFLSSFDPDKIKTNEDRKEIDSYLKKIKDNASRLTASLSTKEKTMALFFFRKRLDISRHEIRNLFKIFFPNKETYSLDEILSQLESLVFLSSKNLLENDLIYEEIVWILGHLDEKTLVSLSFSEFENRYSMYLAHMKKLGQSLKPNRKITIFEKKMYKILGQKLTNEIKIILSKKNHQVSDDEYRVLHKFIDYQLNPNTTLEKNEKLRFMNHFLRRPLDESIPIAPWFDDDDNYSDSEKRLITLYYTFFPMENQYTLRSFFYAMTDDISLFLQDVLPGFLIGMRLAEYVEKFNFKDAEAQSFAEHVGFRNAYLREKKALEAKRQKPYNPPFLIDFENKLSLIFRKKQQEEVEKKQQEIKQPQENEKQQSTQGGKGRHTRRGRKARKQKKTRKH